MDDDDKLASLAAARARWAAADADADMLAVFEDAHPPVWEPRSAEDVCATRSV
jgi:hypothetical protein